MNILFIVPDYYPHIGGVERHVRSVSAQLVRQGCRVTVFVEKRRQEDRLYERDNNVEIIRFYKRNYFIFRKLSFKWQFIKNRHVFLAADVIHFHDFSTMWLWGFGVYFILRCLGKKIFITFHGWEGHVPPQRTVIVKRRICEYLVQGNICAGHFIEKWYGTRATLVTYGGCSLPPARESVQPGKNALFIGRLENDTGIREYIQAWKTICRQFPDVELVICGDGSLRRELEEYVADHGISNIIFAGIVQEPEELLQTAVFVFTSGFLGILEAFAQQTPVIATYDNPLKKDYLTMMPGAQEMFWIAEDVASIIAAIQEVLGVGGDVGAKIAAAYTFARENTWEKLAAQYLELYRYHG